MSHLNKLVDVSRVSTESLEETEVVISLERRQIASAHGWRNINEDSILATPPGTLGSDISEMAFVPDYLGDANESLKLLDEIADYQGGRLSVTITINRNGGWHVLVVDLEDRRNDCNGSSADFKIAVAQCYLMFVRTFLRRSRGRFYKRV